MENNDDLPAWTSWVEALLYGLVINIGAIAAIGLGMAHGYGMWKFWWE